MGFLLALAAMSTCLEPSLSEPLVSALMELALSPSRRVRGATPVTACCHLRLRTASFAAAHAAIVSASQLEVARRGWRRERQDRALPLLVTT